MGGRSNVVTRISINNALTCDYFLIAAISTITKISRSKTVVYAYTVGTDTPRMTEQVSLLCRLQQTEIFVLHGVTSALQSVSSSPSSSVKCYSCGATSMDSAVIEGQLAARLGCCNITDICDRIVVRV